jgi:hypothetical protein
LQNEMEAEEQNRRVGLDGERTRMMRARKVKIGLQSVEKWQRRRKEMLNEVLEEIDVSGGLVRKSRWKAEDREGERGEAGG